MSQRDIRILKNNTRVDKKVQGFVKSIVRAHGHSHTLLKNQLPIYPPLLSLMVSLISFPKFGEITLKVSTLKTKGIIDLTSVPYTVPLAILIITKKFTFGVRAHLPISKASFFPANSTSPEFRDRP